MKKELTLEQKVQREIMKDANMKRIPRRDNKVKPIFYICGKCHKREVVNHHFLCPKCHAEKYGYKIKKKNKK